jgi:hypothetical protein
VASPPGGAHYLTDKALRLICPSTAVVDVAGANSNIVLAFCHFV